MKQYFRRIATPLVLVAGLLAFSAHSAARGHFKPKAKPQIPYTAIASIDTAAMTISTEPKNSTASGTKVYHFTANTKVTVNGQSATLADLKPGMQVHVGAGMDAGTAEEISANPAPAVIK